MAEAIVPHLLQILRILQLEWEKASTYEQELNQLKFLIESFHGFLKKANSMETINDDIKASMKRARQFIYDSQDAIDDFMRHESNHQSECLLVFPRRAFVSQADQIGRMLHRYNNTQNEIKALLPQLPAEPAMSSSDTWSSVAYSQENDNQLEGIGYARDQLVRWLEKDDWTSKVIFVHGVQGVGKTSLVGTVLRNQEVKNHFKYYVWIKYLRCHDELTEANVEMWDLTRDNRRARVSSVKTLGEAFEFMETDEDWNNNCCRWVLILDDACSSSVIESLKSHINPNRPSLLITTRDSSLALFAKELAFAHNNFAVAQGVPSGGEAPDNLNIFLDFKHVSLSMNHPLQLLRREILRNGKSPDVSPDAFKSILNTCEGLPLAILATCDLLKYKLSGHNGIPESVIWERVSDRLGEELLYKVNPGDRIKKMITLRMGQLHDLRACLFYLSIFPLDRPIRCSTLMRLWMAEKFAMQEDGETDRAIADQNLRKLLDHNFIQQVETTSYGRTRTCHVHNLLNKIIMKKSRDDEFAMNVAGQRERWPQTIWRLSLHSSQHKSASDDVFSETSHKKDESQIDGIEDSTRVERLRSLLVFEEVDAESMKKLLEKVKRLNVLHLETSSLTSFPEGISRMKNLRYLKLSGAGVGTIPEDIGHLAHLETLDLKGTGVKELPDGILKLKKLRHLLVYRSDRSLKTVDLKLGAEAPSAIGELESLQNLCMIKLKEVEPSEKWGKHWKREQKQRKPWKRAELLEGLRRLMCLRRLGISKLRSGDVELLCSSINELKEIEALRLIAAPNESINLSQERKAPARLERVHLIGCFRNLSNWLYSPEKLVKLVLKKSQLNGDALQHLGELPGLKHLELQEAFDAREMMFKRLQFQQLRFLGLNKIDRLDSIRVDVEALPTLEILSLARCQSLKTVPQDITRPRNLKCLEISGMHKEFITAVMEFYTAVRGNEEVHKHIKVNFKDGIHGALEVVIPFPAPMQLPF